MTRRRLRLPRLPRLRSRRWALVGAGAAALSLTACQIPSFGAYRGDTSQGQDAFKLWQGFFLAGLVEFLVVFVLILLAVLRFRRRSDAVPRQTQYHTLLEIVYTVLPIITVFFLFGFTFATENSVDAITNKALNINVTAFQWGWQFQYPTYDVRVLGVETQDPTMVVPVGQTVRIFLRSNDVIHGFYVPQFNFSRYAQPGVTNQFDLTVQHAGVYRGQCTQFCGLYHSLMLFQVKAVSPARFQAWVSQQQSSPTSGSIATATAKATSGSVPYAASPDTTSSGIPSSDATSSGISRAAAPAKATQGSSS